MGSDVAGQWMPMPKPEQTAEEWLDGDKQVKEALLKAALQLSKTGTERDNALALLREAMPLVKELIEFKKYEAEYADTSAESDACRVRADAVKGYLTRITEATELALISGTRATTNRRSILPSDYG